MMGSGPKERRMAKENRLGLTVHFTREGLRMIYMKDLESMFGEMEISMKEHGLKIRSPALVFLSFMMAKIETFHQAIS